jgi:hypothetical protein
VLDKGRHELGCSACGAPLHDLKRLPEHIPDRRERVQSSSQRERPKPQKGYPTYKSRPQKRRKGLFRHLMEEAFDVIEDIFD